MWDKSRVWNGCVEDIELHHVAGIDTAVGVQVGQNGRIGGGEQSETDVRAGRHVQHLAGVVAAVSPRAGYVAHVGHDLQGVIVDRRNGAAAVDGTAYVNELLGPVGSR